MGETILPEEAKVLNRIPSKAPEKKTETNPLWCSQLLVRLVQMLPQAHFYLKWHQQANVVEAYHATTRHF